MSSEIGTSYQTPGGNNLSNTILPDCYAKLRIPFVISLNDKLWPVIAFISRLGESGVGIGGIFLQEAHCNNVIPMSLNVKDLALVNPSYQENSTASGLRRFDFGKNWCSANRAKTIPQISIQKKRSLLSKQTQYSHVITALFPQVSLLSLNYNQSNSAKVYCGTLLLLS